MKFEFVEFYPLTDKNRGNSKKNALGTVHIYAIECELDIRGINTSLKGRSIFFHIPHFTGKDHETGDPIRYPLIRWTNEKTQREMLDFLHQHVKPIIRQRIKDARGK